MMPLFGILRNLRLMCLSSGIKTISSLFYLQTFPSHLHLLK